MLLRGFFIFACLLLLAPATRGTLAQGAQHSDPATEEQNETMRDTLKRMQIKREEQEHQKLLDKGAKLRETAEELKKEMVGNSLPRDAEKKLREIEKAARNIRSDFGGNGNDDEPLKEPPGNLADAIDRLIATGDRLRQQLDKTSRRVISVPVIETSSEVIQVVKILRTYLF